MSSSLSVNHTTPGTQVNGGIGNGGSQPPRKRMLAMAHIVVMATYSPSMSIRNGVELYSTMNPATSSDSASTRSNGGRLVSASAETKKTTNIGRSGSQNQLNRPKRPFCASTKAGRFSEAAARNTGVDT